MARNDGALLEQADELDAADTAGIGFRKQLEELRKSLGEKDGESEEELCGFGVH